MANGDWIANGDLRFEMPRCLTYLTCSAEGIIGLGKQDIPNSSCSETGALDYIGA